MTSRQEKLLSALLQEPTVAAAAAAAGVGARTAYRWLAEDAEFSEAYRQARRAAVTQATAALQASAGDAVAALRQVLADAGTPPSCRVAAAKAILDAVWRATELEELAGRVAELEAALADLNEREALLRDIEEKERRAA